MATRASLTAQAAEIATSGLQHRDQLAETAVTRPLVTLGNSPQTWIVAPSLNVTRVCPTRNSSRGRYCNLAGLLTPRYGQTRALALSALATIAASYERPYSMFIIDTEASRRVRLAYLTQVLPRWDNSISFSSCSSSSCS